LRHVFTYNLGLGNRGDSRGKGKNCYMRDRKGKRVTQAALFGILLAAGGSKKKRRRENGAT